MVKVFVLVDLDGVLVDPTIPTGLTVPFPTFEVEHMRVGLRPGTDELIRTLCTHPDVLGYGYATTGLERYAQGVTQYLSRQPFVTRPPMIILHRTHCIQEGKRYRKQINIVWEKPEFQHLGVTEANTLLLDDLRISAGEYQGNLVLCPAWEPLKPQAMEDDVLVCFCRFMVEELVHVEDVREYCRCVFLARSRMFARRMKEYQCNLCRERY